MESAMDRMLYTECVRYGKIISDKEFKTDKGEFIRQTMFEFENQRLFFSLCNGKIIYFRLDRQLSLLYNNYRK